MPLHRSAPFVDSITANLEAAECTDVEIVVSDRPDYDNVLDQSRQR
jgi:hypothetical protein